MKVEGKNIVVSGGGSGIGRQLVLELLKRNASVAALDLNKQSLDETLKLAGDKADKVSLHVVDITDKEAVDELPEKIIARHGSIDGLINNAGIIQPFVKVNDLDCDKMKRVCNVNFDGTLFMIKAFLPHLLQREQAHLLNVSSMGGFLPVPGQSIYGAAKAAVKLLTEALYAELRNTNVNVGIAFPGAIDTNITKNSGLEMPRNEDNSDSKSKFKPLSPVKAAQIIIDAIEKNKFRVFVGSDAKMTNLLYRFYPKFANRFISKRMASLLGD